METAVERLQRVALATVHVDAHTRRGNIQVDAHTRRSARSLDWLPRRTPGANSADDWTLFNPPAEDLDTIAAEASEIASDRLSTPDTKAFSATVLRAVAEVRLGGGSPKQKELLREYLKEIRRVRALDAEWRESVKREGYDRWDNP